MSDRLLLILDLDETLIHARMASLERPADFSLFGYHIYKRPHLSEFIQQCSELFYLAVWSSASDDYVKEVVRKIFPKPEILRFVWGRSRATLRRNIDPDYRHNSYDPDHMYYLKRLKKVKRLGWDLEKMLIVDDTPEKCLENYGNAIYPKPYEGDQNDNELELLAAYLGTLANAPNVRAIEKRLWRQKVLEDGG